MEITYRSDIQKSAVEAMRAAQERRGGVVSELFMHKVLGRAYPAWTTEWPKPAKQTRYAIDGAGYNCW